MTERVTDTDPGEDPGRWLKAMIARAGGPREADWADGRNDFARPHPNAPWVYRGLPVRSCTCLDMCGVGRGPCVDVGHTNTVHQFPYPPCTERTP